MGPTAEKTTPPEAGAQDELTTGTDLVDVPEATTVPTTDQLEAMVQGGDQAVAAEALDNASADVIKQTVETTPSVRKTVDDAKAMQIDGLRKSVVRAADTTNALVAEADAREAAGFTPDAQIDRADILGQQRDTNRASQEVYGQQRIETLAQGAADQEAQHTAKEPLWNRGKEVLKNLFKKKPTDANTGGGEA